MLSHDQGANLATFATMNNSRNAAQKRLRLLPRSAFRFDRYKPAMTSKTNAPVFLIQNQTMFESPLSQPKFQSMNSDAWDALPMIDHINSGTAIMQTPIPNAVQVRQF